MVGYETIIEPFRVRARAEGDRTAITFLSEDGGAFELSAADLYRRAMHFSWGLVRAGIQPGDLVILVFSHTLDLLAAFLGVSAHGAVPSIFPYLTEKLDPEFYHRRIRALVEEAGPQALLVALEFKFDLEALVTDGGCAVITLEDVPMSDAVDKGTQASKGQRADAPALLQYSSGTTGMQKGVLLPHRTLLDQIDILAEKQHYQADSVMVNWLPLYHDMGLVGGCLLPLCVGIPIVWISPFHWVREPRILFEALHAYGGSHCYMPNFAYNHCVRSVRERDLEGIDLSHVQRIINGGEPVRHQSLQLFLERFGPYGLREGALATGYGMAELTLGATSSSFGEAPMVDWVLQDDLQRVGRATPVDAGRPGATPVVSSGTPLSGVEMRILDEAGEPVEERVVGEIALKSRSMFKEYYRRPELTAQVLRDGWFHTSDMGYIAGGELFVLGRVDDLVIVGGRNIYPQDVEALANRVEGVYQGRAAAFAVDNPDLGTDAIVLACELRGGPDEEAKARVESELRRAVVAELDVTLADVVFVERGWIVKTSNGKIARKENRAKYFELVGETGTS
jgi:acyl-CoA synthetase (AMP-forming)/AMP-acid ligase II